MAADRIALDPAPAGATAADPATARSESAGAAATWRRAPESTAGGARQPGGIGVASTLPVSWAERRRAASEAGRALADAYAEAVPMDEVVPDFVAERLRPLARRPPRAVLDLGAGDGRYLAFFGRLFPEGTLLVGAELSLVRARRLAAAGFRAVVAAAEALPFRAAAVDLVTLLEVIEHTRAPGRALDEAGRVLAPSGRLVLTTPNYPMKRVFDARAALRQRRLERLWDDPTHISPLTAGRLERLLAPRFGRVELEGTALPGEGLWPWLASFRRSRAGRRLSNKLFAVCGHGGVADG